MKIRHNPNPSWQRPSASISEPYENEIRRSTEKLERQYAQAQKRFDQAQARLEKVCRRKSSRQQRKQIAELEAMVELRRVELEKYRRMMVAVSASATHRGTQSFRPVGLGGAV